MLYWLEINQFIYKFKCWNIIKLNSSQAPTFSIILTMHSNFYCIVLILVSFPDADNLETTLAQFEIKSLHWIPQNSFTTDLYSKSAKLCALFCVLNEQCAISSYSEVARTCRIDHSGKCFFLIEPVNEWAVVKRKGPREYTCTLDSFSTV